MLVEIGGSLHQISGFKYISFALAKFVFLHVGGIHKGVLVQDNTILSFVYHFTNIPTELVSNYPSILTLRGRVFLSLWDTSERNQSFCPGHFSDC